MVESRRRKAFSIRSTPLFPTAVMNGGWHFRDLTKLLIEGFSVKAIRSLLEQGNISYESGERSLALLEKLINGTDQPYAGRIRLSGLRQAQLIRTKGQSHQGGSEGDQLAREAVREFGSYKNHFEDVCTRIVEELEMIEACISVEFD